MLESGDTPPAARRCALAPAREAISSAAYVPMASTSAAAPAIFESLQAVEKAYEVGERDAEALAGIGRNVLASSALIVPQYWEVRDPESLGVIATVGSRGALLAVAASLGKTRLIDNLLIGGK